MHLTYPPKFYKNIVSNFSRVFNQVIPTKVKDNGYAKFRGETRCIMVSDGENNEWNY